MAARTPAVSASWVRMRAVISMGAASEGVDGCTMQRFAGSGSSRGDRDGPRRKVDAEKRERFRFSWNRYGDFPALSAFVLEADSRPRWTAARFHLDDRSDSSPRSVPQRALERELAVTDRTSTKYLCQCARAMQNVTASSIAFLAGHSRKMPRASRDMAP